MKRIEQTYDIKAPITKTWQALTDPKLIEQWGGGPATMSDKAGTEFSLWGGDIFGKNVQVVPPTLLVQQWSDGKFAQPSNVRFELADEGDHTLLQLVQDNLPDDREQDISEGWRDYYLGPLKAFVEG